MKYCKKCGAQIEEGAKFCSKCGAPNVGGADKVHKNNGLKVFFIAATFILALAGIGFGLYKMNNSQKEDNPEMQLVNIDVTDYPEIKAVVMISNYDNSIDNSSFIVKENDSYEKDIDVEKDEEGNYVLTYDTSDKTSKDERKVKICYSESSSEIACETSYTPPEKEKEKNVTVSGATDNTVNTYDENEIDVKNLVDKFISASVSTINSRDLYYIKSYIDLSGSLVSEYEETIESYKAQRITESLLSSRIDNIEKLGGGLYEVTTFERYRIYYGVKQENKNIDFRSVYIVKDTESGFKVNSIKEINKV